MTQSIINRQESNHILALSNRSGLPEEKSRTPLYILLRKIALVHAIAASIWTIIMVLPMGPFPLLLRIIVGGGPSTWFIMGYLLFIITGSCGFAVLSYVYYTVEKEGKTINNQLALLGIVLTCVGTTAASTMLQIAGALGGYQYSIMHSPTEKIRLLLEPLVNPIRLLTIIAAIGIILQCLAALLTVRRTEPTHILPNPNDDKNDH